MRFNTESQSCPSKITNPFWQSFTLVIDPDYCRLSNEWTMFYVFYICVPLAQRYVHRCRNKILHIICLTCFMHVVSHVLYIYSIVRRLDSETVYHRLCTVHSQPYSVDLIIVSLISSITFSRLLFFRCSFFSAIAPEHPNDAFYLFTIVTVFSFVAFGVYPKQYYYRFSL